MSGFSCAEQMEEGGIVGVLVKDSCSAVTMVQDVIGVAGAGSARNARNARNARHEALTMEDGEPGGKRKVAPLFLFNSAIVD